MKKLLYITNAISGSGGLERVLSVKTKVLAEDFGYVHIITVRTEWKTNLVKIICFSFFRKNKVA
jgi:hypothetical protein